MINVYEELKGFKDRYTKNIIYELYIEHPELQHEIEIKIHSAIAKKTNDSEVSLLKKCNLLKSNEHLIKDGMTANRLHRMLTKNAVSQLRERLAISDLFPILSRIMTSLAVSADIFRKVTAVTQARRCLVD